LGKLFEEHRQEGTGAEVGCYRGDFTRILADQYWGKILAIDYFSPKDFLYYRDLEEDAKKNLAGTMCKVIKGKSLEVAKTVKDNSLDWVYIDANHSYEAAKEDIAAWYPKVRIGGIVSGHDYIENYSVLAYKFGVYQAVNEFCEANGYQPEVIHDTVSGADFASWYFEKK